MVYNGFLFVLALARSCVILKSLFKRNMSFSKVEGNTIFVSIETCIATLCMEQNSQMFSGLAPGLAKTGRSVFLVIEYRKSRNVDFTCLCHVVGIMTLTGARHVT